MNRRKLLKGFLGIGAALVGGRAVAEETELTEASLKDALVSLTDEDVVQKPLLALKAEHYERKYWEAQSHINMLYNELKK